MELKRIYAKDAEGKLLRARGDYIVTGVHLRHAGPAQKFSQEQLDEGLRVGYVVMDASTIEVRGVNATARYRVLRAPGFYCCHCGEKLEGDPRSVEDCRKNAARKAHVAASHPGVPSPDPQNPAGYRGATTYECEKVGS
jgi:hypothetical protein